MYRTRRAMTDDDAGFDQNVPVQHFIHHYSYVALFLLALAESACIPIPSEVTFGFAGALCTVAVAGASPLNLIAVIVVGVLGEVVGALISYTVGRTLGRAIVDRWGKWLLLSHRDLDNAERWFDRYGAYSVLVARVIPVVRSVISVPAGVAEMSLAPFVALTAVGSAVWISVLAGLGDGAGHNWKHVERYFHAATYPVLAVVVVVLVGGFVHRWRAVRHAPPRG
jgi:membrane protein DedA with SNARE-associated domain